MNVLPVNRRRVFGMETEYGVHPVDKNTSVAQSQVDAALPRYLHPALDGFVEYGRIYPDQSKNIEVCSPELLSLDGLLASHFAGEELAQEIVEGIFGGESHLQKRSTDSSMGSRGDHENFLVGSGFNTSDQVLLAAHLITRSVLTGPGVVYRSANEGWCYALDPRALSSRFGDVIAEDSTANGCKPLMKDMQDYDSFDSDGETQRLQVVSGSHNMFPYPIAARIFNTSSVLRLIEQGKYPEEVVFDHPNQVWESISKNIELDGKLRLLNGKRKTAVEIQMELLEAALELDLPEDESYMADLSCDILADIKDGRIDDWQAYLEWYKKFKILAMHSQKNNYHFLSARSAEIDIKWHERRSRPECISDKLRRVGAVAMMPDAKSVAAAKRMPPDATRGRLRANAIRSAAKRGYGMQKIDWEEWQARDRPNLVKVPDAYGRRIKY